ncbi:unnamed protein product [marine sediment metagenome]|uniref:Uncharacterized protein n=1 Tax=marine sediment metagenome TaxID=412755 RepID=X0U9E8_9ZZZZ
MARPIDSFTAMRFVFSRRRLTLDTGAILLLVGIMEAVSLLNRVIFWCICPNIPTPRNEVMFWNIALYGKRHMVVS